MAPNPRLLPLKKRKLGTDTKKTKVKTAVTLRQTREGWDSWHPPDPRRGARSRGFPGAFRGSMVLLTCEVKLLASRPVTEDISVF